MFRSVDDVFDVAPVEFANDIAWLQFRLCGGRPRHYFIHHHSVVVGRARLPLIVPLDSTIPR